MSLEEIIAKAQKQALATAKVKKTRPTAKVPVKREPQPKLDPYLESIVAEAAKKAMDKHSKKQSKQPKKSNRRKRGEDSIPKPHERMDIKRLKDIYAATGLQPMRGHYWFLEPREKNPMIRRSDTSEDGTAATPFGALAILRRSELIKEDNTEPEYQKRFSDFMVRYPSWQWFPGSLSQLCKFTCSYILGFHGGWDGNAPGHRLCSQHYHTGYEDGKAAAEQFEKEGLLPPKVADPHKDVKDPKQLDELHRVRGYERKGHVPYQKSRITAPTTAKERRREKMRRMF